MDRAEVSSAGTGDDVDNPSNDLDSEMPPLCLCAARDARSDVDIAAGVDGVVDRVDGAGDVHSEDDRVGAVDLSEEDRTADGTLIEGEGGADGEGDPDLDDDRDDDPDDDLDDRGDDGEDDGGCSC